MPSDASRDEILRLLKLASRAPSVHNTQPWRVTVGDGGIVVRPATEIRLPFADPTGRGGWIAVGAFAENMRQAAQASGREASLEILPDGTARIALGAAGGSVDERTQNAIAHRATCRGPFAPLPDAAATVRSLSIAPAPGTAVTFLTDRGRIAQFADLIREGTRLAYADRGFCVEHAQWLRSHWTRRLDGIPGYAIGIPPLLSLLLPTLLKIKDASAMRSKQEWKKAVEAPLFALVTAEHDAPAGWSAAGVTLERLLIAATAQGLAQSPSAAAIEMGGFASRVVALFETSGTPQLAVRLGRAELPRRQTPRLPPEHFTTWENPTVSPPSAI